MGQNLVPHHRRRCVCVCVCVWSTVVPCVKGECDFTRDETHTTGLPPPLSRRTHAARLPLPDGARRSHTIYPIPLLRARLHNRIAH